MIQFSQLRLGDHADGGKTQVDKLDGFILIYGANQFLHGIVKVLKRNKVDGPRTREIARVWTVRLFQIDDKTWTPHWLMKPFEDE